MSEEWKAASTVRETISARVHNRVRVQKFNAPQHTTEYRLGKHGSLDELAVSLGWDNLAHAVYLDAVEVGPSLRAPKGRAMSGRGVTS